jgi:hypothetical protein
LYHKKRQEKIIIGIFLIYLNIACPLVHTVSLAIFLKSIQTWYRDTHK